MKKLALSAAAAVCLLSAGVASAQPGPGGWDLGRREAWMQQRIDRGMADGSLTRHEGHRVQRELNRIRYEESRLRRMSGGRLRPGDRDRLEAQLDNLNTHIRWARHNAMARPW
jgi:hypothetical protein